MKPIKLPAILAAALMLPFVGVLTAFASPQDIGGQEILNPVQPEVQKTRSRPAENIDKRLVGWHEAGLGTESGRIGNNLRANWVMLNSSDGIQGQIVGISESVNVFLMRNGFVVGRTSTSADGKFELEAATPGPYTMIGYSPESIFTYSFNAVANDGQASGLPTEIRTLPITGRENNKLVAKLIKQYSPEISFREYGNYDVGQDTADPAEYFGWDGLKNLTAKSTPSTTIQHHKIAIHNDGRIVGRVHQLHNRSGRPVEVLNSRIMIIQEGEMIAETQVDNVGVFQFAGLAPGTYGLVVVGSDGLMAIGLELVAGGPNAMGNGETAMNLGDDLFRNVAFLQDEGQDPGSSVFDATLSDPESAGWINNHVDQQTYQNAMNEPLPEIANANQMPYNYFDQSGFYDQGGFGGGGGGGGYGFGGGFGDFLLPVGLGAIIGAIDNDNNIFFSSFSGSSPSGP